MKPREFKNQGAKSTMIKLNSDMTDWGKLNDWITYREYFFKKVF